jgi:hypothetical protein
VDGDGRDDLIVTYTGLNDTSSYTCRCYTLNTAGNGLLFLKEYLSAARSSCHPAIAAFNADEDSALVEYAGHELKFSSPIVIASLGAAPYHSFIVEAGANPCTYYLWSTSYGTYTSSTTGSGTAISFSVGGGVKGKLSIKLFGYAVATTGYEVLHSEAFSWEWDSSTTVIKSVDYIGAGGQDIVIFTAVPVDEYHYTVLDSPDAYEIGTTMTISIPRDFRIIPVTREFYNKNNGDLEDVLPPHTVGDPWSYPDSAEKAAIMASASCAHTGTGAHAVAQASGESGTVTELTIEVAANSGSTFSWDESTCISTAMGTEAIKVVVSLGFGTGYRTYESWTTGTRFGGTVGYLPTDYYMSSYIYSAGLFAFKQPDRLGNSYWMVEYWVEE